MPDEPAAKYRLARAELVLKDYEKAFNFAKEAADAGYGPAMAFIGVVYENGLGMEKDLAQALVWYRKAADKGYAPAESELGRRYYFGTDLPKSFADAAYWNEKASSHSDPNAQYLLAGC